MTAARRRKTGHTRSLIESGSERQVVLKRDFRRDLAYWIEFDPRVALRVMRLIEDVVRDPFRGTGKPELLKHGMRGYWSRRITDEHRMLYEVEKSVILFALARHHYQS